MALAALSILFTISGTALTAFLKAGNSVISSYTTTDQILPSQITIARLIRSQVEPAPTPATGTTACSAAASVPCPAFLTGSVGTYSVTFYANVGASQGQYGPAKIVMAEGTPTKSATAGFYTAPFTVTEYKAVQNTCPTTLTSTNSCTWSASGTVLVDIPNVVNGAATVGSSVMACGHLTTTPLCQSTTPIFTYNTIDPYSQAFTPNAGGTPNGSGILPTFNSCTAPTVNGQGTPTQSNCPPDTIQSVGVDLVVQTSAANPAQENAFTVYRLSSASYLYSTLVG